MNTKTKPKVLTSDVFTEGEGENASSWRLIFYPYGHTGSSNTHIAVFIQAMNIDDSRIDWWKAVNYRISFVDSKKGNVSKALARAVYLAQCRFIFVLYFPGHEQRQVQQRGSPVRRKLSS